MWRLDSPVVKIAQWLDRGRGGAGGREGERCPVLVHGGACGRCEPLIKGEKEAWRRGGRSGGGAGGRWTGGGREGGGWNDGCGEGHLPMDDSLAICPSVDVTQAHLTEMEDERGGRGGRGEQR